MLRVLKPQKKKKERKEMIVPHRKPSYLDVDIPSTKSWKNSETTTMQTCTLVFGYLPLSFLFLFIYWDTTLSQMQVRGAVATAHLTHWQLPCFLLHAEVQVQTCIVHSTQGSLQWWPLSSCSLLLYLDRDVSYQDQVHIMRLFSMDGI